MGPLGRTPTTSGAHCQVALIRYPEGESGLMVYIKPSLTGDESTDILQYAKAHPEFPSTDIAGGAFNEADFESYRRLGQHIAESLLVEVGAQPDMPTAGVFRLIGKKLLPDFEADASSSSAALAAALPQELVDAIASRECVLWAGSGLAAQAKLPTWLSFFDGLLRAAQKGGLLDNVEATSLSATLAAGELEAVADELMHQVPREFLLEYVYSIVSAAVPSEAHEFLAQMPFLSALNANIDDLLARAFNSGPYVPAQAEELVAALAKKRFFVANMCGSVSKPSSLLFTVKEFRRLLSSNMQFKQFLGTLFLQYTVVFVGSSIDGIRDYLEALELPRSQGRKHYALIPNTGHLDPVKLRFLERSYNVRVVDFQPGFNFLGLLAFLKQLQSEVSEKAPRPKASADMTLKSISLRNMGPFDTLHLELTPSWNLLLGDNGVGKTVVLKAVAAALCGDKASPAAVTRLLKSRAASGSIRLKVGNREYTVELKRDDDGKVRIESPGLSPIKAHRWLVLGFPALRSILWERPKGPNALRPESPSPDDLLPILLSEPDDRIADIKQWLVNLDYASRSEVEGVRARNLLKIFFEVFQALTPDMCLRLHSIDKKTMEITVETDAGLVPLESISQGTGSVMCWIGTLLERLSETDGGGDPRQSAGLVLIDELDAHMHPKWQQMFVSAFRDQFKSVQIIATTHSPLLVGSLKPEEIWLLQRGPVKSEIYGVVSVNELPDGQREIVILGPEDDDDEDGHVPEPREERRYVVPAAAELLVRDGQIVEEQKPLVKNVKRVVAERARVKEEGWRADQILTSPLFRLETTRDPETAELLKEYTRLTAIENLSDEDKVNLANAAQALQIRLPMPHESEAARKAYNLIRDFVHKSLESLSGEKRQEVLTEVKVQLTESITGSRRRE